MNLAQLILKQISNFSVKRICIIGNMDDDFYEFLSDNISDSDTIYLFNNSTGIKKTKSMLNGKSYKKIDILSFPSTDKIYDWYGWQILKYYNDLKKLKVSTQIFTVVFYKGKHLLQYDMGVLPLLLKMISDDGFLVIYDCSWSLAKSPTLKPEVNTNTSIQYTQEQINLPNMQYLIDTFIDNNFIEQKDISSSKTRVYCKKTQNYVYSLMQNYY